jgi:FKBP-type peptidyl-prolyl cis-trans isomerase
VENPGDQSMKADSGKIAVLKYKGYLQSNGTVFDTNFDSSKGHADPINVSVGSHSVIPAWEEALPHFGKGGSGKILVPAFLGYGPQGRPPVIPPNANLVFDIQVLDVKQAPPAQKVEHPSTEND